MNKDKKIRELQLLIKEMQEQLDSIKEDCSELDFVEEHDEDCKRRKHCQKAKNRVAALPPQPAPLPPLPPHLHEDLEIDFRIDEPLFERVFGDHQTAHAVVQSVQKSPVEIKAVLKLLIDLYEKIEEFLEQ